MHLKSTVHQWRYRFGYLLFISFMWLLGSCSTHRSFGASSNQNTSEIVAFKPNLQPQKKDNSNLLNQPNSSHKKTSQVFKDPERSFRGVWVATVANIDWPKHPSDSFEKMQEDYKSLLKFYKDLHFNTVIVQVRAAGDALYPSKLAPWSKYLSGKQGLQPQINIDPLEWLIETTHAYGMDFHAWINPYRATMSMETKGLSQDHDFYTHREWLIPYGNKYYYNPGLPEVREHMLAVVRELVNTYQIDGLHLDDYFYPYKIEKQSFKDETSYRVYGGAMSLGDWRRQNVDSLIAGISNEIKQTKPWVSFGVSPFGVWKNKGTDPKGSDTRAGQTTFEDLYADPLVWMREGWIDYLVPQLYWSMNYELAAHKTLVDWWANQKSNSKIYIGYGPYKIFNNADNAWDQPNELGDQIAYGNQKEVIEGQVFFSAKSLMQNSLASVVASLKQNAFKEVVMAPLVGAAKKADSIQWKADVHTDAQGTLRVSSIAPEWSKYIPYFLNTELNIYEAGAIRATHIPFLGAKNIEFIKGINSYGQLSAPIPVTRMR